MNREIKFRAFHKTEKKMYNEVPMIQFWNGVVHLTHNYLQTYVQPETCVLMQYTGLKDKNGKEIYEGDIVRGNRWSFGSDKAASEPLHNLPVTWAGDRGAWTFGDTYEEQIWNAAIYTNYEVIGNIYENKELL